MHYIAKQTADIYIASNHAVGIRIKQQRGNRLTINILLHHIAYHATGRSTRTIHLACRITSLYRSIILTGYAAHIRTSCQSAIYGTVFYRSLVLSGQYTYIIFTRHRRTDYMKIANRSPNTDLPEQSHVVSIGLIYFKIANAMAITIKVPVECKLLVAYRCPLTVQHDVRQ